MVLFHLFPSSPKPLDCLLLPPPSPFPMEQQGSRKGQRGLRWATPALLPPALAHGVWQAHASSWPQLGLWEGSGARKGYPCLITWPRRKEQWSSVKKRVKIPKTLTWPPRGVFLSLEDETINTSSPLQPARRVRQRTSCCFCLPRVGCIHAFLDLSSPLG